MDTTLLDALEIVGKHLITIERNGRVAACCEWDWVRDYDDMIVADTGGIPSGGNVLYVSNIRVGEYDPSLIWKLKRLLPKSRWIVGMTEQYEVRAPKGLPEDFYACLA